MHDAKEMAGIGGESGVPPLPFDVQSDERERRFPGARDHGDHRELVMRDRNADIFEVVLAGTFDGVFHSGGMGPVEIVSEFLIFQHSWQIPV